MVSGKIESHARILADLRAADPVAARLIGDLYRAGMIPGMRAVRYVRIGETEYGQRAGGVRVPARPVTI